MEESPPFKYEGQDGPTLIGSISNVFDIAGIPNVLWGDRVMGLHGIALMPRNVEFVIPDEDIYRAYHILLERGLRACSSPEDCITSCAEDANCSKSYCAKGVYCPHEAPMLPGAPAATHLHLSPSIPRAVLLLRKSEILWTVPSFEALSIKENPEARIILASDTDGLPEFNVEKHFIGAWVNGPHPIRIPSWHCLLEAYVLLAGSEYREGQDVIDIQYGWFAMVEFMKLFQRSTHPLNLELIDPRCRPFCQAYWKFNLRDELRALSKTVEPF